MSPVTEVHTYTKPQETVENPYFPKGSAKTSKKPLRLSTVARKHKIFYKARLTEIQSRDLSHHDGEVATSIKYLLNAIWKVDPNAVVLSWQNEESSKVIRNKASLPDSKKTAKPFFNGLFTVAGRSPYVRFILAHDES